MGLFRVGARVSSACSAIVERRRAPNAERRWTAPGTHQRNSYVLWEDAHGKKECVKHPPVDKDYYSRKEAELANRANVDKVADNREQCQISQGS